MNLQRQIDYWVGNAKDDMVTSELLINNNRLLHGLFWYHLTIEKSLKAHVVRCTQQLPPKTHNLLWLIEKTDIDIDDEALELMGELMVFQLEGRYPENYPSIPPKDKAVQLMNKTRDLHLWLISKF